MNKKNSKKRTVLILTITLSVLAIGNFVGMSFLQVKYESKQQYLYNISQNKALQEESIQLVRSYPQAVNEDGIAVEMRENPYFKTKMPGFEYPEAETITYYSTVTNTNRHANVILPVNYDKNKQYPVLYLMHGLHGSHRTWLNKDADIIIANAIYFYGAKEMIVVLPNSNVNQAESDEGLSINELVKDYDKIKEDMLTCLMPYINEHYSVAPGRDNTAIAGNSMGGRATMDIAFNNQELFGYVGAFSSAVVLPGRYNWRNVLDDVKYDPNVEPFKLVMLVVGKTDDVCGICTYDLHDRMLLNGIEHIFYDTTGGHANAVWQNALHNFVVRIFK